MEATGSGNRTFVSPCNTEKKTRQEEIIKKAAKTTERETPAAAPFVMEKSRKNHAPNVASNSAVKTSKQTTEKSIPRKIEIIDLGNDDDEGDNTKPAAISNQAAAAAATVASTKNLNTKMWHCISVRRGLRIGGLFSISLLKKLRDSSPSPTGLYYKVWKEGQREEEAILLEEAIRRAYRLK
ncbi:unnamed protein product [Linum tenue]|nr:unnamed protein product [Linum tenue]